MSVNALQPVAASQAVTRQVSPAASRGSSPSASALNGFRLDHARTAGDSDTDQLRELTELMVSTAFISPMFEQMRSDPLAANLFHGGRAEEVFQQQLDQVYADRIAGASKLGLADALYNQLTRDKALNPTIQTYG